MLEYRKSDFDAWDGSAGGSEEDPRLGSFISPGTDELQDVRIAVAGFPVDDGVRINGGRVGAAHAPDEIRDVLYGMTPDPRQLEGQVRVLRRTVDVGNLRAGRSLAEKQEALGAFVQDCLAADVVPVILGGGHETAYGHFLGYAESGTPVDIVNIDAHADVRPLVEGFGHSGSSFRQALEHASGACRTYSVAGLQPGRNAVAHIEYLAEHGGRALWATETTSETLKRVLVPLTADGHVMLTLDMDAVDQSYAPGVSAPTVGGLEQQLVIDLAHEAGSSPAVSSLDLVEVNPLVDEGGRTVRLAARLVWGFLLGFSERV